MKQKLIEHWQRSGIITDKRVIKAFEEVKREQFIHDSFLDQAYSDYPLPIGHNQTISQPTTIMIMTQALELKKGQKVLEIGSGSGYQAALIAKIVGENGRVITTERIAGLAEFAKANLKKAGIKNVKVINCDGSKGYEKEAPYDRCIITAACPKIPEPIIHQLKENAIVLAPVGSLYSQKMVKGVKKKGKIVTHSLGDFVFVPLKGEFGFKD